MVARQPRVSIAFFAANTLHRWHARRLTRQANQWRAVSINRLKDDRRFTPAIERIH